MNDICTIYEWSKDAPYVWWDCRDEKDQDACLEVCDFGNCLIWLSESDRQTACHNYQFCQNFDPDDDPNLVTRCIYTEGKSLPDCQRICDYRDCTDAWTYEEKDLACDIVNAPGDSCYF